MTPNEQSALIRLAREAGCSETWGADSFRFTIEELDRFAQLVRNAALEEAVTVALSNYDGYQISEEIRSLKS